MNKQTMNLLLLGLAGATAYLGYRFWQTQKAAKEAESAAEDAAVLAMNGETELATVADQQAQDALKKAAGKSAPLNRGYMPTPGGFTPGTEEGRRLALATHYAPLPEYIF